MSEDIEAERPPLVRITESSSTRTERRYLKWALQAEAARLLPQHKVGMCCKMIAGGKNDVPILINETTKHARYGNLCTCAKLWVCPVCASRITERRAVSIGTGIRRANVNPVLITFTLSHHVGSSLRSNLGALVSAYGALTSGRTWDGFTYVFGWITAIRALEVTYGENGWHPHLHILAFFDKPLHADDLARLEMTLSERWQGQLSKVGAYADRQHGVDVRAAFADVAEYVAKFGRDPVVRGWTIERELTKAPTKVARAGGFTPFALLEESANGNVWAGNRFVEYAQAMVNKAQLYMPPNARELLGLGEQTDDELASAETIDDIERVLIRITREQWSIVLQRDARRELLEIASHGDTQALESALLAILNRKVYNYQG